MDGTSLPGIGDSDMALSERETGQLRAALQEAVVKCSERCLYQSSKWYVIILSVRYKANEIYIGPQNYSHPFPKKMRQNPKTRK